MEVMLLFFCGYLLGKVSLSIQHFIKQEWKSAPYVKGVNIHPTRFPATVSCYRCLDSYAPLMHTICGTRKFTVANYCLQDKHYFCFYFKKYFA